MSQELQRQALVTQTVLKTGEPSEIHLGKILDVPVDKQRQVPSMA